MSDPATIRAHIKEMKKAGLPGYTAEVIVKHAVAALELLDNAAVRWHGPEHGHVRLVPDPGAGAE